MLPVTKGFSRPCWSRFSISASFAAALNNVIFFSARILLRAAPCGNVTKVGHLVLIPYLERTRIGIVHPPVLLRILNPKHNGPRSRPGHPIGNARTYFALVAFPSNMFAQVLPLSVDMSSLYV
jgi:hypothetical protein